MTKEEAIRIISGDVLGTTEQTHEAVTMAVEALKRTEKRTETHECDYISRQAALDAIEERIKANGYGIVALVSELNRLYGYIRRLPSVQSEHSQNTPQKQPDLETFGVKTGETCADAISRQEVIEIFTQLWDCVGEIADKDEWEDVCKTTANELPSAQPEIIHCYDCIYYDPEHVEKNGVRYEYEDMPKAAFDILGTGLVNSKYGVNVGGRCCRDYNVGYPEDKRVFVPKTNYCGIAERRNDE